MSQLFRKVHRLIFIYAAPIGRSDALAAITHDGPREKPEWQTFKRELTVQVDQMTTDETPLLIHNVVEENASCIVVRLDDGQHFVLFPAYIIEQCRGSVSVLRDLFTVYQETHDLGLGLPEPAQLSRITQPSPAD